MKLSDVINDQWLAPEEMREGYAAAKPFPHIVMENFIKPDLLDTVVEEFPDLRAVKEGVIRFENQREIKLAGRGMGILSPAAVSLTTYLNSDLFLQYLNQLTGIEETLISDPYLEGGGYHEIKRSGLLKVHADFNRHPKLELDRRLNLLIYLNKDWDEAWGGQLQLFDNDLGDPVVSVYPKFNTAVIFSTTSFTYHGHPDPLMCPEDRSRRSLAYYYFSTGRPQSEVSGEKHSTLFRARSGENLDNAFDLKGTLKEFVPPILLKTVKRVLR